MKPKIRDAVYVCKFGNRSTMWVAPTGQIMERNEVGTTRVYMPTKDLASAVAWLSHFWKDRNGVGDGRPCWIDFIPALYPDEIQAAQGYLSIMGIKAEGL